MLRIPFFLRFTLFNFFLFIGQLLMAPFSQSARHKLAAVFLTLKYPYFGKRYIDLSDLLKNDELHVEMAPVKSRMHNTTSFELLSICSLLKDNGCNNVFEIGTFDGRTTRAMALNLEDENGMIFTLNLPPSASSVSLDTSAVDVELAHKVTSGERFLNTAQQKQITQLWGDSANFDFSPYKNSMDMVFIDGAHSEYYASNDTFKAIELIRPAGGLIVWHDAHLFGVVKFLKNWIDRNDLPVYFVKDTSLAVAYICNGKITDLKTFSAT